MTGVSVFIRINLWLKCVLHFAGLFAFFGLLLNQCSIYQILMLHQDLSKQWVSYAGFDATFSHFYYVFMVVSILCIIDRQVEYIFRLDFKLSKRLEHEDQESHIMSEINEILLKNILPAYVAQKFLNNSLTLTDDFYSESYQFCAVMFASIPNYSDFYSEDILNGDGIKCLQLLNEIICDFDQVPICLFKHLLIIIIYIYMYLSIFQIYDFYELKKLKQLAALIWLLPVYNREEDQME